MHEQWIIEWLTAGRYAKYVRAAGGDHARALALYEWNADLAATVLHDLSHLEVGIRNAYDRALLQHPVTNGGDWLEPPTYTALLPPHWVTDDSGNLQDKNSTPRGQVKSARKAAGYIAGGPVPRGTVVAELMFGFWSYLTDSLHEKTLWVPALHEAFVPGADRARIHGAMRDLRDIRNRVAHHESVFDQHPENLRRSIVYVARNLSPDLQQHITRTSRLPSLLQSRP